MPCATDITGWTSTASDELLSLQNADGGWPYHAGEYSSTEPTALAILALHGFAPAASKLEAAADWLFARQRSDGFFTAAAILEEASWVSPLAAMAMDSLGRASATTASALIAETVFTFNAIQSGGLYGYDTTIPGWPWTNGDYSFTEPTSLAMIFLKRVGQGAAKHVRDAASMFRHRVLPGTAWNYGEPQVQGGDLFPTVAPTALALLALADEQDATTDTALSWLLGQQGQITSLFTLAWAVIALNLIGSLDDAWRQDVTTQWCAAPAERRGPLETALCLLALRDPAGHPLSVVSSNG